MEIQPSDSENGVRDYGQYWVKYIHANGLMASAALDEDKFIAAFGEEAYN